MYNVHCTSHILWQSNALPYPAPSLYALPLSAFPPNQYIWVGCYIRQIVFFIDQYFAVEYNYKSNVYSKEGWHIGILEFYCLSSSLEWDILSHVTPLQFCCLDSTSGSSAKYKTLVGKSLSLSYRALWLQAPKDKKKVRLAIVEPFEPLWNVDKPARFGHFGSKIGHFLADPSHWSKDYQIHYGPGRWLL